MTWTAPAAGRASVVAMFVGLDDTSTDVHVLVPGQSPFSNAIRGQGDSVVCEDSFAVTKGDVFEFAVGSGGNGDSNDATQIDVRVTLVSL